MIEEKQPLDNKEDRQAANIDLPPVDGAVHIHDGDVTVLFGKTYHLPLYTSVFVALGILTLIEILLSFVDNDVAFVVLIGISVTKALLVILFYMHLKNDDRLFAWILAIPVSLAMLTIIFLIVAAPNG
jgi:caa(3)-type oxidase subunit IV